MHELSIAHEVVELAVAHAQSAGVARISAVTLRIGALTCVHADALEFGFEVASAGTLAEGATLRIEALPVAIYCPACSAVVELPGLYPLHCPRCGTPSADVRQGQELELASIEAPEEP